MTKSSPAEARTEPVVITTPLRDEIPVDVVEEEEPLQDSLIRKLRTVPALRRELLIGQESAPDSRPFGPQGAWTPIRRWRRRSWLGSRSHARPFRQRLPVRWGSVRRVADLAQDRAHRDDLRLRGRRGNPDGCAGGRSRVVVDQRHGQQRARGQEPTQHDRVWRFSSILCERSQQARVSALDSQVRCHAADLSS
jgi:hypothetical protein